MPDHLAGFFRERMRFETCVDFAISVSRLFAGRQATMPQLMASYVFTRTCVSADSLSLSTTTRSWRFQRRNTRSLFNIGFGSKYYRSLAHVSLLDGRRDKR